MLNLGRLLCSNTDLIKKGLRLLDPSSDVTEDCSNTDLIKKGLRLEAAQAFCYLVRSNTDLIKKGLRLLSAPPSPPVMVQTQT